MSKSFWAVIVAIVIVLGGIFWLTSSKGSSPSSSGNAQPTNHVEGSTSTGVKLVEYGDYECPYCAEYYSTVKQVASQYSSQIQFQFRNLPLTQIHQNAFAGARAAEAAALQGKFWQMHDLLYENNQYNEQTGWVVSQDPLDDYFVAYAQQLGLNIAKFKTDFASEQVNNVINADVAAFKKTGAEEATPTFFLDGKQIQPGNTVADFQKYINAAIKDKASSKSFQPSSSGSTSGQQSVEPQTSNKK
ncbi:MAG TPA: thioredoxin domain-containing protein [Candidatus Saccharimonadales bacterium]